MKINMYAVKDIVAGAFGQPFLVGASPEHALAIRTFEAMIKNNPYYPDHADDYRLYYLGEYEDTDGSLDYNPEFIISALQFTFGKENK